MFELTDELVRQIIFAMENQNIHYMLDTELGVLVREELVPPEERPPQEESPEEEQLLEPSRRYQPLPGWTSADGFYLMERFLGELHNPVARNALQEILLSGKRVFRRFKDTIREYPEVEKRYYRFKFVEMRRYVREWYSRLMELAGLDTRELEADQDLDDLVLTDISLVSLDQATRQELSRLFCSLDQEAFTEAYPDLPEDLRFYLQRNRFGSFSGDPGCEKSRIFGAFTPQETLCGFLWLFREALEGDDIVWEIHQLYVYPEHRGLGVASSLLDCAIDQARAEGVSHLISRLPGTATPQKALLRRVEGEPLRRDHLVPLAP
ncbi:Acetyltransferase (GNAT) family protein [Alkalispirochaeta americana]|uniref:Acetyltransferase (GNAT) family protein n=1 Tax=Alkalispirochaeta americana TaxID=159291 RepID=A0A1N6N4B1_9SPIO|nr:GNAT family N-acetyltransferase [Alkalispirochaeta americana]SIP86917.1 Acetyltransferase (GNAT) family protein [Alkalispirochaeta americana]